LLIHGWSGRGLQLGCIARALADAGFCAVAIDLPAHGKTPGYHSNAFAMAGTIRCVAQHYDSVENKMLHGIVTHSFGAVPALYLLRKELKVERVACICPPDTMEFLFGMFVRYLQIPPAVEQRVKARLEKDFGQSIWQEISPLANVQCLSGEDIKTVPGAVLIVHDEDDREVGIERGEALAAAWSGASLQRTSGLGHTRILRDQETIDTIVRFITA
jgi:pimeloyl-ACP methyl ester carboxylesterase